jgi:hypothetical protein
MIGSGFPDFISDALSALFAPAGAPPEIIAMPAQRCREAFVTEKKGNRPRGQPALR